MKKVIALLSVMAMVLGLTACGSSQSATTEPVADVEPATEAEATDVAAEPALGRTTFTVGFDAEFPPYGYMDDNGDYVGFDLDLAQEVCNRLGWELVKKPIDWASKDLELSQGSIDCIWNGFTINGREDDYTWSVPYVNNRQVFVVAEDSGIAGRADLAGKVVGVQADSSALAALEDEESQENLDLAASFTDLVQYADYNTAFMDLETGAIDALAVDIGVASYQVASRNGGYVILDEDLSSEQYAIGFLLGEDELKDTVEATLLEMVADGTFASIVANYEEFNMAGLVCLE